MQWIVFTSHKNGAKLVQMTYGKLGDVAMSREFSFMRFGKGDRMIEVCLERKVQKNGFAGFVFSKRFHEDILIVVNDILLNERNIRGGYITVQENGTNPIIILNNWTFNEIKRGVPSARLLLFHEIGHYCCGHLNHLPTLESEHKRRREYAAQNSVSPEELEADSFAADYLGGEYVVWALQDSMESRLAINLMDGVYSDSALALQEYQLRIDAINEHYGLELYEDETYGEETDVEI